MKARLEEEGLKSFVKTTGGKGLHVVTPPEPAPGWDEASAFARQVAFGLAREEPRAYVAEMSNLGARLKAIEDPWRDYWKTRQALPGGKRKR